MPELLKLDGNLDRQVVADGVEKPSFATGRLLQKRGFLKIAGVFGENPGPKAGLLG